ncbi:hypothetical protein NE237_030994 [Protea cynaroides]|uniref:Uncharacterized protein n=1 Tax=Protea cynaroides TaxID=273540 RepID=A0A9Q0GY85_9MAGN|nr:hypothetical protein NE237_030994 [Protea cynaroides]
MPTEERERKKGRPGLMLFRWLRVMKRCRVVGLPTKIVAGCREVVGDESMMIAGGVVGFLSAIVAIVIAKSSSVPVIAYYLHRINQLLIADVRKFVGVRSMKDSNTYLFDPRTIMDSDISPDGLAVSDGDFGFAFNDSNFSDRVLRIKIRAGLPEYKSDGEGCNTIADWARNRKRRRKDIKKENKD